MNLKFIINGQLWKQEIWKFLLYYDSATLSLDVMNSELRNVDNYRIPIICVYNVDAETSRKWEETKDCRGGHFRKLWSLLCSSR